MTKKPAAKDTSEQEKTKTPAAAGTSERGGWIKDTKSFGRVNLKLCTEKSYILRQIPETGKWTQVVCVTQNLPLQDHQRIATYLFQRASDLKMTKEELVEMRNALVEEVKGTKVKRQKGKEGICKG